jgi:hypothetical protein
MTEPRGTSAGWRTAAVVAPAAAAAFALATGWAIEHPPESSDTGTSAAQTAQAAQPAQAAQAAQPAQADFRLERAGVALHRRALVTRSRVAHLNRVLTRLQARTEAIRIAALPHLDGGSSGSSGSGSSAVRTSGGGGSATIPAPPGARAPARAPATHTSTGAS